MSRRIDWNLWWQKCEFWFAGLFAAIVATYLTWRLLGWPEGGFGGTWLLHFVLLGVYVTLGLLVSLLMGMGLAVDETPCDYVKHPELDFPWFWTVQFVLWQSLLILVATLCSFGDFNPLRGSLSVFLVPFAFASAFEVVRKMVLYLTWGRI